MWTKTIIVEYKRKSYNIQIWLSGEKNKPEVTIQSMVNEWFLMETIEFENRDACYEFINHYSNSMGKSFLMHIGHEEGYF
jgi:hypothetical protein